MKPHVFSLPTRSYVSIMSSMNPVLRHAITWFIRRSRGMEVRKHKGISIGVDIFWKTVNV